MREAGHGSKSKATPSERPNPTKIKPKVAGENPPKWDPKTVLTASSTSAEVQCAQEVQHMDTALSAVERKKDLASPLG